MVRTTVAAAYWKDFLASSGRDKNLEYFECFHFCDTEEWANKLLELVLDGIKTATSSSLRWYEAIGKDIPKVGDLSIVTDWEGNPKCVIETTDVLIIPFEDMTYEICKREGEDDDLESWRDGHIRFFTSDGKAEGYEFTPDMPVVFEDFRVVYRT